MRALFFLALTMSLLALGSAPAGAALLAAGDVGEAARWEGEVVLAGPVRIPPGAALHVAPGTRVRPAYAGAFLLVEGSLLVEGTEEHPVIFLGEGDWEGISFRTAGEGSRIAHARFSGAKTAISSTATNFLARRVEFRDCDIAVKLLRLSNPELLDCLFASNRIGVDLEMKSAPVLKRNRFHGHREAAIFATHGSGGLLEGNHFQENSIAISMLRPFSGDIAGNVFTGNRVAVYCDQTAQTPPIRSNLFRKNAEGVVSVSYSAPRLEDNTFIANKTAVRNDQLGSPAVIHNLLRGNGTGIVNLRRSAPIIRDNVLERNERALFCDYSSYPVVRRNNFLSNPVGVELGDNQSGDWERQAGSRSRIQAKTTDRKGTRALSALAATQEDFAEFVDVSSNWWGEDTVRLTQAVENENLPLFHDRADRPTVTKEGFGDRNFRLDQVRFRPLLTERVDVAGPRCGRWQDASAGPASP